MSNQNGDDEVLDRLTAGESPASEHEAAVRAPYERLLAQVKAANAGEPAPGWEARVDARLRAERDLERRRRRRWQGGGMAAVLAAVALLIVRLARPTAAEQSGMTVAVESYETGTRGGAVAKVGDSLLFKGVARHHLLTVRVYRDNALVAQCPGDERCRIEGRRVVFEVLASAPGTYRTLFVSSRGGLPPLAGTLDDDLRVVSGQSVDGSAIDRVDVRPVGVSR